MCILPIISVQRLNAENQEQRTEFHDNLATIGLILVHQVNSNPFRLCGLQISLCNF